MKLSKLKLNPNNPQKFDDLSKLKNSIKEFPKMLKLRQLIYDPKTMYVLGGNKRLICLKELGYKEVPDEWVKSADELTEDEKHRFVVQDNIQVGDWDFELLDTDWDTEELEEWGVNFGGFDVSEENMSDEFSLPDGDKEPFQQMTFTLADKQVIQLKNAITNIKKTEEYKYCETFGNVNSNGNALYLIIMQWIKMSN